MPNVPLGEAFSKYLTVKFETPNWEKTIHGLQARPLSPIYSSLNLQGVI